jgi:hypothetical protein
MKKEVVMTKSQAIYDLLMCECEAAVDDFAKSKFSLYHRLIELKPAKKYVSMIAEYYSRVQEELRELVDDKAPDLVEAYDYLKVSQRKKFLAFVTSIVDDATSYAVSKKKVRVKRKVSFEKVVSKLKYKQSDGDFKLNSIDPVVIPQSEILFVFNTKYRHLFVYQAKEGEKLSVKGTTLQNFDEEKSYMKRVRKPQMLFGSILQTTRLRAVKVCGELKSKPNPATGRINGDCILLRAI